MNINIKEDAKFYGVYKLTIRDAKTGRIKRTQIVKNLLPTVGRTAIMDHLTNASPSPAALVVNKVALGTNTDAPAAGDTILGTEVYRNNVASRTKSNNIGYITGFFSATEDDGTYKEVGLFINGEAGADSGTLFSHAAIDITKSNTETLTIDFTVTLS